MSYAEYQENIINMINELIAMTNDFGLGGGGKDFQIISQLFTYKFLNDKLAYEFENRKNKNESFEDFIFYRDEETAAIKEEYLIKNLFKKSNDDDFAKIFDKAFKSASEENEHIFSIETTSGNKKPLFITLKEILRDDDEKEKELAKRAINILYKYDLGDIYTKGWDYFSVIFEHLKKNFNKENGGNYAEYYTPAFAGAIMAEILFDESKSEGVTLYDPAAGSGTLLMSMADKIGTKNCTLYSQDYSEKSTQFLRINLILNNLVHSLANVAEGNTMTNPAHLEGEGLMKFDYIVSNPPFNIDFSGYIKSMENDKFTRFQQGLPNVPDKDLNKMAIYLPFLQHILASLEDDGRAAIVVPNGFLTAKKRGAKIAYDIRKKVIDENWLRGVVSMPPNIFATTGTNVSILFLDKTRTSDDTTIFLVDASNLGEKRKLDEGQKTILLPYEEKQIIDTFLRKKSIDKFSVEVNRKDIISQGYIINAGQYFKTELSYSKLTPEQFNAEIERYKTDIKSCFDRGQELEKSILTNLRNLKYDI